MATECFHGIYNQQEGRETFEALWHKSVFQPAWVDMQHHVSVSWATFRLYFPYTELKYQWPNVKCGLLTCKLTDSRSLARKATNEIKCLVPCQHCTRNYYLGMLLLLSTSGLRRSYKHPASLWETLMDTPKKAIAFRSVDNIRICCECTGIGYSAIVKCIIQEVIWLEEPCPKSWVLLMTVSKALWMECPTSMYSHRPCAHIIGKSRRPDSLSHTTSCGLI